MANKYATYADAWEAMDVYESELRQEALLSRFVNPIICVIFLINAAMFLLYQTHYNLLDGADTVISGLPVIGDFIEVVSNLTNHRFWNLVLFAAVFNGLVPAVLGWVVKLVLSCFLYPKQPEFPELPENVSASDIIERHAALKRQVKFFDPSMHMLWAWGLEVVFYILYIIMASSLGADVHWFRMLLLSVAEGFAVLGLMFVQILPMCLHYDGDVIAQYKTGSV